MAAVIHRMCVGGAGAVLSFALMLPAATAQPHDTAQQARDLIAAGRPTDAVPLLQQAVQAAPQDPQAHYALAEAYFRSGNLGSALLSLRAAEARSTDPAFLQNVQAKAKAIEAMLSQQGIATPAPAQPVVPPAARPMPQPPPPSPPVATPSSDFDAADAALRAGDLDRAHILALTGLRNDPRSARGNYLLAEVLVGKKDLGGARKAYEEALNGTNLPPARKDEIQRKLLRLEVAMEPGLGEMSGAPESAGSPPLPGPRLAPSPSQAPTSTDDNAYRSPVNAAASMAASGNLDSAVGILRAHLAGNPSDVQARIALAGYLRNAGDDVSALDELGKAISGAPNNDNARNMRVLILMQRGEYGAALADLDAIVVAGRATATTYINRGVANQRLGEMSLALQDYDKALALEPTNTGIHVNKATVLIEQRQDQAAIDVLSVAIARDAYSANAFLYRGMAYFNLGRFTLAVDDFGRALALDPSNAQAVTYRENALKAADERAKMQMRSNAP
ncbi:MAG: tetratricopeptide repeat protein [Sphingomonadales bacterium]